MKFSRETGKSLEILWAAYVEGSERSLSEIVELCSDNLYFFILSKVRDMDVSREIEQEIWISISLRKPVIENFKAYIYQAATFRIISYFGSKEAKRSKLTGSIDTAVHGGAVQNDWELQELEEHLNQILEQSFSEEEVKILRSYREGFSNEEIGRQLNRSMKTIANKKLDIRKRLKALIKKSGLWVFYFMI